MARVLERGEKQVRDPHKDMGSEEEHIKVPEKLPEETTGRAVCKSLDGRLLQILFFIQYSNVRAIPGREEAERSTYL
jgi:hypothetical protein